jgi:hypothetical protein
LFLAVTLVTSGCSDSDDAPQGAGGSGGTEGDLYALTSQVLGEQAVDNLSYVIVTDTLDPEANVGLDAAQIELTGRALGVGPDGGGALFIATDGAPTVTRYELSAEGKLVESGSVSFLTKGITEFGEYGAQFQFISASKAYWFDGPTAQVVIWDPSAMTVTSSISLASLAHENEVLTFTAAPVRSGDKLYSFVGWRNGPAVPSRAAVIVVDTASDTARIVESDRCGYVRDGVLAEDGMLYVATEAYGAAVNYLNPANASDACMLRFDPVNERFDDSFFVSLKELAAGRASGTLLVGGGSQVFLRVLDPSRVPAGTEHPRVLASAPAWGWAKLILGETPSLTLTDAPATGGSVLPFMLGERAFAPVFVDGESTEFVELTADGPASSEALRFPGLVFSAVKLK